MPTSRMFDSTALVSKTMTLGADALGRPTVEQANGRPVRCRVSAPTALDLEAGRDGKHVIEAVLFFPLGTELAESDVIDVAGQVADMIAPPVQVSSPTGIGYVKVPVRWVRDSA